MDINKLDNPIKVCGLVINNIDTERSLWNINWCNNISKKILVQKNGRCYYIVVNDNIYKIGYSDCVGGIKSTITSYRSSGNSGRPSDRTHGIHILITEQLILGNKVEIYFNFNPLIDVDITLMDGSIVSESLSISGKILELKNIEIYKNIENEYPIWNLQESGKSWPIYIQESRKTLLLGNPVKLKEIKERISNLSF
jgi:hypothetical protein